MLLPSMTISFLSIADSPVIGRAPVAACYQIPRRGAGDAFILLEEVYHVFPEITTGKTGRRRG